MKTLSILGLCLVTAVSASAQMNVVKEAERAGDIGEARKIIAPALTNEESKKEAYTWYVAGKKEFENFDNLYGKKALGQNVNGKDMGNSLVKGYEYYIVALPLDSVPEINKKTGTPKLNKDGSVKVKTKYSKDIINTITGHHNDFLQAGQFLYDAKDYAGAAKAWGIYVDMPSNQMFGKAAPKMPADTLVGQMLFYKGIAEWQSENLADANKSFSRALNTEFKDKQLYDYAMSVAAQLAEKCKDDSVAYDAKNAEVVSIARKANEIYGKEDSKYISIVINDLIIKKEYAEAQTLLEQAIANNPTNSQLLNVMGVLLEAQKKNDEAMAYYQKAVETDPKSAKNQYDLGRMIYIQAASISEGAANLDQAKYSKVHNEQVLPLLKKALPYLEEAYKLDETSSEYKQLLRRLYYDLNMGAELEKLERGY